MADTVFNVIKKEINEHQTSLINVLVSGRAKDYAEYRHLCGEIRGLTFAHSVIDDLVQRMERDDDD